MKLALKTLHFLTLAFCFSNAFAENSLELSDKLMDLRSKIQQEADQLESEKLRLNANLQSLTVQKGELTSQKDLYLMKKKEMGKSLAEKQKAFKGEDPGDYKGQSKKIDQGLDDLLTYYQKAIPFRLKERTEEINKLKNKKENKELTVSEYTEAYWSLLQRELRFSESVEIQKGFVEIDDNRFEVEFLKVGMFGLYFKTRAGEYGYFTYQESEKKWIPLWIKDSESKRSLSEVFIARSQGVTDGIYSMPLMVRGIENVL
jgi:hypothetical protein